MGLAALVGLLSLFWAKNDRETESYAGVRLGMTLKRADVLLDRERWTRLNGGMVWANQLLCGEGQALTYLDKSNPGFALVLHTDDDCQITKILRRTRPIEI